MKRAPASGQTCPRIPLRPPTSGSSNFMAFDQTGTQPLATILQHVLLPPLCSEAHQTNMLSSKPLMYAELLSNIRQISVIVALNAPCDLSTQVELSRDGRHFILHHGGESSTLTLPGQISCNLQLPPPARGSRELTWRLPIAGEPPRPSMDNTTVNVAPWAAKFLGPQAEFMCRACGAVIVGKGSIAAWRDLPSENWAEMMDFWHCHKPDLPVEQAEHSAASRGHVSNTRFTPTPGVGFVDVSTFLLADIDCRNIQVSRIHHFGSWVLWYGKQPWVSRRRPRLLLLFNGLVTDTNTRNQYSVTTLLSSNLSCLSRSLDCGLLV